MCNAGKTPEEIRKTFNIPVCLLHRRPFAARIALCVLDETFAFAPCRPVNLPLCRMTSRRRRKRKFDVKTRFVIAYVYLSQSAGMQSARQRVTIVAAEVQWAFE